MLYSFSESLMVQAAGAAAVAVIAQLLVKFGRSKT
jgi:hypothetical protein